MASTQRQGRRRRNDPQGVRARILDRAADLFQRRGYHSTSMHDLLQATGVSAGALHHHFPTKKSLALAVISDRVRPLVRELWIEPVRQSVTLEKGVIQVLNGIISGIEERGSVFGCALNNLALELALTDRDMREGIEAVFAEWRNALAERIEGTRGGMRLDRSKRSAAANFVIAVYSGAMNMAKATQSAVPLSDAAGLLAGWLREQRLAA
jgi:AcrR family transcriptional regulator